MLNTPFSPWPSFTQEEADAVSQVLLSNKVNYWTGQECRQFETEFAKWSDSKYAIAMGNGGRLLPKTCQRELSWLVILQDPSINKKYK